MFPATGEDMLLFVVVAVGNEVQSCLSSGICHKKDPKNQNIADCQALAGLQKHLALSGWQKLFPIFLFRQCTPRYKLPTEHAESSIFAPYAKLQL